MLDLSNWVDNRIIWAQFLPRFHLPLDILSIIFVLDLFHSCHLFNLPFGLVHSSTYFLWWYFS